MRSFLFLILCLILSHGLAAASRSHEEVVWSRLDMKSFNEQLSFIRLYPDSQESKQIETHLKAQISPYLGNEVSEYFMESLKTSEGKSCDLSYLLSHLFVEIISKESELEDSDPVVSEKEHQLYEKLREVFEKPDWKNPNSLKELSHIPSHQVDALSASFLIAKETGSVLSPSQEERLRGQVNLMALMAAIRLDSSSNQEEVIQAINQVLFFEQSVAYPPRSKEYSHIDDYSSIPEILNQKKGVCLGTSILFWAMAQRLDLQVESVIIPGHIYLRTPLQRDGKTIYRNIETTSRGIHLPDELYQPLEGKLLRAKNLKEALGSVFINSALASFLREDYEECLKYYRLALPFINKDQDLYALELYAYALLLNGKEKEARPLIKQLAATYKDYVKKPQNYPHLFPLEPLLLLDLEINGLGGEAILLYLSETREDSQALSDQLRKWKALKKTYPQSKSLHKQIARVYLSLGQVKAALEELLLMGESLNLDTPSLLLAMQLFEDRKDLGRMWETVERVSQRLNSKDKEVRSPWGLKVYGLIKTHPSKKSLFELLRD